MRIIDVLNEFFKENGYSRSVVLTSHQISEVNRVECIKIFIPRIMDWVFLHLDGQFLALEQPHELGAIDVRPHECFKLWVNLNDPDSLQTMLNYLSQTYSWRD